MYDLLERPPIDTTHLSLILTVAGNVADAAPALGEWVGYLNGSDLDYEILLVSEQAAQAVEELAAPFARVRPLPALERSGFGVALAAGLAHAQHPLVFYGRCQLAYKPADVKLLLKQIDKVDMVVGQRMLPPGHRRGGLRDRLYGWFVRLFFGVHLRDLDCLFALARRSIFARIPIQSRGLFAHVEVLAKANFLGCYFSDAAVAYRPDADNAPAANRWLADARRLIADPDFGPVRLPEETAATTAVEQGVNEPGPTPGDPAV